MVVVDVLLRRRNVRREKRRSGEDRGVASGADLPDVVSGGVCYEGVAVVVDGDVVCGGGGGFVGWEGGEEDAAAGAEVVGGEGVEQRKVVVDDGEEAVAVRIDGEAEDGGAGGEVGVGDEGFDDAGVGDGGDDALPEGSEEEVLGAWIPRE